MGHAAWGIGMTRPQKPQVLVVDDDDFQQKIVSLVLSDTQYQLAFVCSGEEAIHFLQHTQVDLVLMDVQMPGIGGLEATRRLKSMPHLAQMPILIASGEIDDLVVAQCLQAGAADFVLKPFNRTILSAKVASLSGLAASMALETANERKDVP